jgi:hypothetical protein
MEHDTKTNARCVAVDDEGGIEVRQQEHRADDQDLLQQLRERAGKQVVILDEFTIVTHEAEEASYLESHGARPSLHRLDLGWVHGHASVRDDVAEVGDRHHAKGALLCLTVSLCCRTMRTSQTCCRCSAHVVLYIRMPSKNTSTNRRM